MLELSEWISTAKATLPAKPWLVLGKGPTFSHRVAVDLDTYNLLSLNHVVREQRVDVAHVIDVDVVEACADALRENCEWLVMPRVPHVHSRVGHARLEDYFAAVPVLRELDDRGRLVWYNAETAGAPIGDSPVVEVRYFSSEAALSILGELGADVVRSLGVDGGSGYSQAFASSSATRLANGQPSFDVQFDELARIAARYGIDYRPIIEPFRVYVGASRRDLVAVRVLAHSIHENSSIPVRVIPMVDLPVPTPKDKANRPRTGFSFARFLIPELAGYSGRAVYVDSDMLVFGDVAELASLPLGAQTLLCTNQTEPPGAWSDNDWFHPGRQFSVMVLDCARLQWKIDEIVHGLDDGRYTYQDLLFDMSIVPADEIGDMPNEWNHLEHHEAGVTKLVHFTVVDSQPWRAAGNPLEGLWFEHYRAAVAAGAVPPDEVRELVAEGLVRKELLAALDDAPPRAAAYARSAADVALDAAFERIEELEGRQLRGRVRTALKPLAPMVRRARALGPDSAVGKVAERVAGRLRRTLR